MVFADEWLRSPKWKLNEYKTADLLGGKRRPQRKFKKQGPDVNLDVANVEVKSRARLPKWICEALQKCSATTKPPKLAALLCLENNQKPSDGLVVMTVPQFQEILKVYRAWLSLQEPASTPTVNVKSNLNPPT